VYNDLALQQILFYRIAQKETTMQESKQAIVNCVLLIADA